MGKEYRWRRMATRFREVIRAEGYVMLRAKGCLPFLIHENDLVKEFFDTRRDSVNTSYNEV